MKKNPELEQCTVPLYGLKVSEILKQNFNKLHDIMKDNKYTEAEKTYIARVVDEKLTKEGREYHFWDW